MTTHNELPFDRAPADFIDVGHSRLAYRRIGAGPDLVFVHGWPLSSATWRDIAPALASDFTCHLIDLPGAGFTEFDAATPIGIRHHADTVERAVEALELDDYALIGHDSGAAITRHLAARHGRRVRAMVMGNTEIPGHHPFMLKVYMALHSLPGGRYVIPAVLGIPALRRSAMGFGGCFADRRFIDGEFFRVTVEPLLRSKRAAAGQMRLLDGFDIADVDCLRDLHQQITAPVQLIWGSDDPWFPLKKARGMVDQFPGGTQLEEIPRGKLFAHEEFPETFADYARPFLRRAFTAQVAA